MKPAVVRQSERRQFLWLGFRGDAARAQAVCVAHLLPSGLLEVLPLDEVELPPVAHAPHGRLDHALHFARLRPARDEDAWQLRRAGERQLGRRVQERVVARLEGERRGADARVLARERVSRRHHYHERLLRLVPHQPEDATRRKVAMRGGPGAFVAAVWLRGQHVAVDNLGRQRVVERDVDADGGGAHEKVYAVGQLPVPRRLLGAGVGARELRRLEEDVRRVRVGVRDRRAVRVG
eukprot:2890638-Prymnesium_polylepis.1